MSSVRAAGKLMRLQMDRLLSQQRKGDFMFDVDVIQRIRLTTVVATGRHSEPHIKKLHIQAVE